MIYLVIVMHERGFSAMTKVVNDRFDANKLWEAHNIITDAEVAATSIITKGKRKLPDPDPADLPMLMHQQILGTYEISPKELRVFLLMGLGYSSLESYMMISTLTRRHDRSDYLDDAMEYAGYGVEWIAYRLWGRLEHVLLRSLRA